VEKIKEIDDLLNEFELLLIGVPPVNIRWERLPGLKSLGNTCSIHLK